MPVFLKTQLIFHYLNYWIIFPSQTSSNSTVQSLQHTRGSVGMEPPGKDLNCNLLSPLDLILNLISVLALVKIRMLPVRPNLWSQNIKPYATNKPESNIRSCTLVPQSTVFSTPQRNRYLFLYLSKNRTHFTFSSWFTASWFCCFYGRKLMHQY